MPTKSVLPVQMRYLIRRDFPEVLAIENAAFDYPWTEDDMLLCLRARNCIGQVAQHQELIVGFVIYELLTELHVLNFAVDPAYRGRGIGTQLVDMLKRKLANNRRDTITLEVRESNLSAQLFFQATGFAATDVLRGHYEETEEDAYQMEFLLKGKSE